MILKSPPFPKTFSWGVATAALQIEGGATADGKGESNWDRFSRKPGIIADGSTPAVACDHYHRYRSDLSLMQRLGVKNYRLSLSWSRIFPAGQGVVNQKGAAFYDRLIDAMLAKGITPWVTMFHWDLPQALEDEGGWRARSTVDAFAAYADTIVQRYGDRVKNWITLNEVRCFTILAYGGDLRAPGVFDTAQVVNQTYHHALLSHGHGVRAVREHGRRGSQVGIADDSIIPIPVTETPTDIAAAKKTLVSENLRVLDPIYRGRYSPEYLKATGKDRPVWQEGDFKLISLPTDFLGLNIYTGRFVRAGKRGQAEQLPLPKGYPAADANWLKLIPQALYWGPRLTQEIYGVKSVYVTENGAGYDDPPPENGEVLDLHRREYIRQCLVELRRSISDGAPVHGYFLWSFMDNFEWRDGYTKRFGIVYVDYATQRRTPKLSARWYTEVMRTGKIV